MERETAKLLSPFVIRRNVGKHFSMRSVDNSSVITEPCSYSWLSTQPKPTMLWQSHFRNSHFVQEAWEEAPVRQLVVRSRGKRLFAACCSTGAKKPPLWGPRRQNGGVARGDECLLSPGSILRSKNVERTGPFSLHCRGISHRNYAVPLPLLQRCSPC